MAASISIGDIVNLINIVYKIYVALNDAHGSADEYWRTRKDIESFHAELDRIERQAVPLAQDQDAIDLASSLRENVEISRQTTEAYLSDLRRYEKAFGKDRTRMNKILSTFWKIDWFFRHRGDASEVRQHLQAGRTSLNTNLQLLNL